MKASELRPGQFFATDEIERAMFIGVDGERKTYYNYAYRAPYMQIGYFTIDGNESLDFEVTPLSVHGWDDGKWDEDVPDQWYACKCQNKPAPITHWVEVVGL